MSAHSVFCVTVDGNRYRVLSEGSYDLSLQRYASMDAELTRNRNQDKPVRVNDVQVDYFNVRAMDDEHWGNSPHALVFWGYTLMDYSPGGSQWRVTRNVKLSEVQREAMAGAAINGYLGYNVHHKCRYKLESMDLTSSHFDGATLTDLGKAVANREFMAEHGMSVKDYQRTENERIENERIALRNAQQARKVRAEALALRLSGLTLNGSPAPEALIGERLASGRYIVTLDELEAIVNKVIEDWT